MSTVAKLIDVSSVSAKGTRRAGVSGSCGGRTTIDAVPVDKLGDAVSITASRVHVCADASVN